MNLAATPSHLWTERYESLRGHVLGDAPVTSMSPLGLAVLQQKGVTDWMQAWTRGSMAEPHSIPSTAQRWGPSASPAWQQELTKLLAHMTIQLLHPTRPI